MSNKNLFEKLGLFDAKVPRYTSYPTAPQFSAELGAPQFTDWVRQVPENSQISLYIHVPFCRRLCWFCACRTQGTTSLSPVASYVETLKQELALLRSYLPNGISLSRLHWGGGTPTLLDPAMMEDLCGSIFDLAPMAADGEFSVEIDPNEINAERLEVLAKNGMNRASIGVQDFNPEIQKTIGREQSYEITRDAVEMIRAQGVKSLNADILFGLPHQTNPGIAESVQKLLSLTPDRVALYGYAHVPWMAKRQQLIPAEALPSAQARLELFETAEKLFLYDGYEGIGIDHFALPSDGLAKAQRSGTMRRNFQGYTDDQANVLIGVGASSISRFPQGYAQNAPSTSKHVGAIREAKFSTVRGHVFEGKDKLHARLIEAVMCDFAVDSDAISQEFDVSRSALKAEFDQVNARFEGLLRVDDAGLYIPKEARPLTRLIAQAFDAYDAGAAQHSSAV